MVSRVPLALERASFNFCCGSQTTGELRGPFPLVWILCWRFGKEEENCDALFTWSLLSPKFSILLPLPPPILRGFLGMGEGPERTKDQRTPGSHLPPTSPQLWVCQDFLRHRSSEEGRGGTRDSLSARDFLPPFSSLNYSPRPNTKDPADPGARGRTRSIPAPL